MDGDSGEISPVLEVVRQRWIDLGIVDAGVASGVTCLVFYCGTGWRSSLSLLVAHLLGYRAKNYDDGFYGWSWDSKNPVEYV
ncbi:rhodanese-like domain-containing protein [Rubritalea tangerina]|uniref:rhodanese-like domain-containing protein n=1 Tax=Rubritalea tangerina TaxID=430798 RepID=UPI00360E5728